jgi:glucose/arabinose dehydrogenase/cytochrome c5
MYYSFSNNYKLVCFLIAAGIFSSCHEKQDTQKFTAPVKKVIRLDSTEIGISTVLSDLNVPWEIAWGPDGQIWFTEQSGTISKVDPHTGKKKTLLHVPGVYPIRTLGLLGMAISPDKDKPYVFIDYTHRKKDSAIVSRLVRYTYTDDTLKDPFILLEVPASTGHNGSRVAISADGKVFWSIGDIAKSQNAQDTSSLNGKIVRLNMDGSIPEDNPFQGSPVWSLGHRNIQGLAFTPDGTLFSSEHGDATDDEINIIMKGRNYGWPEVRGYCDLPAEKRYFDSIHTIQPVKAWTPTIAPSGIGYYHSDKIPEWNNAILVATLKGVSLRVLKLNHKKDAVLSGTVYFKGLFGRLRDICVSPEGDIYLSTSNRDWNPLGKPKPHDDRIVRIARVSNLDNLSQVNLNHPTPSQATVASPTGITNGATLYQSYCASCHKSDGNGIPGTFPALHKSSFVLGRKEYLISIILNGEAAIGAKSKNQAGESMPAFNFLSDNQIAGILTYIRSSWGNHADSVSAAEVNTVRKN